LVLVAILTAIVAITAGFGGINAPVYFRDVAEETRFYLKDIDNDTGVKKQSTNDGTSLLDVVETVKKDVIETIQKEISLPKPLIGVSKTQYADLTSDGIFAWTQVERYREGVEVILSRSGKLDEIARRRLLDMFEKQYFEHVSPQGQGAGEIAKEVEYRFISIGENLAMGFFDGDQDVVKTWMDSPGHRKNILNPRFVELGVAAGSGIFKGERTWIAVQIFGRPLSYCVEPDPMERVDIERNKNSIQVINGKLISLREEMDSLRSAEHIDRDAYNSKVTEYNELVSQINLLVEQTKIMVESYNEKVRLFNECVSD